MPLGKNADAGDYVKDFQKSDAPQFKGKSKEKKQKMAVAAFLDSRRKKKAIDEAIVDPRDLRGRPKKADSHPNSPYGRKHPMHPANLAKKKKKRSVKEAVVDFDAPGMMFKVSVEGLPDMIMGGKSPSDVKSQLRKIVKQPSMIQGVKRMPKAAVKKMFRDIFQGREEDE